MAQGLLESTKLRLVFEAGLDDLGKPIYKSKTFSNHFNTNWKIHPIDSKKSQPPQF